MGRMVIPSCLAIQSISPHGWASRCSKSQSTTRLDGNGIAAGEIFHDITFFDMKTILVLFIILLPATVLGDTNLPFAESVLVDKSERKMWLISKGKRYREYNISLGDSPIGHKEQEGDEKTPEGKYLIDYRNPKSRYHLSLHISYPRKQDKENPKRKGVSPGGDIFIHGLPNGMGFMPWAFNGKDWTDGCIAVNNQEIEEIWKLVKNGTPIEILP